MAVESQNKCSSDCHTNLVTSSTTEYLFTAIPRVSFFCYVLVIQIFTRKDMSTWRAKGINRQMFREMKAICRCNRLRNTETKIIWMRLTTVTPRERSKATMLLSLETSIPTAFIQHVLVYRLQRRYRFFHCRFDLFDDANAPARRRLCLHKSNAVNYSLGNEISQSVTGCYRHEANI